MLSSPSTEVRESLQCLACAAQQEMNVFNVDILRKLMLEAQTKSSMVDGESVGKTWDKCVVSFRALSQFVTWADVTDQTKSSEKLLNRWLDSSVYIAKALSNNNKSGVLIGLPCSLVCSATISGCLLILTPLDSKCSHNVSSNKSALLAFSD